jgi:acetoin utilization deacetylase AcuC-like enzyme
MPLSGLSRAGSDQLSMKLYTTDLFVLPLPNGHRFPMQRYRLLRERLQNSGCFAATDFCIPPAATAEQLALVHTHDWISRVFSGELTESELRRIGFPWSRQMVERSCRSTGATIAASRSALQDGLSVNLAGGTHHAFPDRGAGYCVFNDVAVAVRVMQSERRLQRAVVVDGDVHQGDGTAAIFQEDNSVRTFSLHARKAFPVRKMSSDLDVALEPGTGTAEYLAAWQAGLEQIISGFEPELIYFLAGADPWQGDTLGGLQVTARGLQQRDHLVFELSRRLQCPLVIVMAGGYAEDPDHIATIQYNTVLKAAQLFRSRS